MLWVSNMVRIAVSWAARQDRGLVVPAAKVARTLPNAVLIAVWSVTEVLIGSLPSGVHPI
ncbi:hypothetical protein GCM10010452_41230 [Crossiella cryophila]